MRTTEKRNITIPINVDNAFIELKKQELQTPAMSALCTRAIINYLVARRGNDWEKVLLHPDIPEVEREMELEDYIDLDETNNYIP